MSVKEAAMRVSQLMHTPVVTCSPQRTVRDVCALMDRHRVGAVVVMLDDTITGIVTDRDIALRAIGQGLSGDLPIEQVMTRSVASVRPTDDLADAERTMADRRVRRLPVVDDHGRLHGMLALDDVVGHIGAEVAEVRDALARQAAHS
jgi:CBS domain-containing protein